MMTNVGMIDRVLRLAIGLALLAWAGGYFGDPLPGWADTAARAAGAFFAVTGFLRYCPIFALAGISTCADDV